jgi:transposase
LVDQLNTTIDRLIAAAGQEARKQPEVLRLMTHPGVVAHHSNGLCVGASAWISGSLGCGHQIGNYPGLIPCEDSSADRQRLGHITKPGRFTVALSTGGSSPGCCTLGPRLATSLRSLAMRRDRRIAKVAMARKLAVSLYWMWRKGFDYQQTLQFGSHAGEPRYVHGVK